MDRVGQEHRRLTQLECLRDPVQDAAGKAAEADFTAEGAGKFEQARAVVKLVLVERTVQPALHVVAQGREQQRDNERRDADHDEVRLRGRILQRAPDDQDEEQIDRQQNRTGDEVGRPPADDHFDIEQAIVDDRVRETQRDDPQEELRRFHGKSRPHAQKPRQRVNEAEGKHAGQRSVTHPLHLLPGRKLPGARPADQQQDAPSDEPGAEIHQFDPVEDHAGIRRARQPDTRQTAGHPQQLHEAERERRHVDQRRPAAPLGRIDREPHAEVDEQCRQQQKGRQRETVNRPVEGPEPRRVAVEVNDKCRDGNEIEMKGPRQPKAARQDKQPDTEVQKRQERAQPVARGQQVLPGELEADRPGSRRARNFVGHRGVGPELVKDGEVLPEVARPSAIYR